MRMTHVLIQHPRLRAAGLVVLLLALAAVLLHLQADKSLVALVLLIVGLVTKAFTALVGLIALVPGVGPVIAQVITLPLVLVINGLTWLVTFIALKRGERVEVMRARVIAWSVLLGFVLGFLAGRAL
jgi:hypothetical protein